MTSLLKPTSNSLFSLLIIEKINKRNHTYHKERREREIDRLAFSFLRFQGKKKIDIDTERVNRRGV